MKKIAIALALAASTFAVHAGGPFDGIYQSTLNGNTYYSVHQDGDQVRIAEFTNIPAVPNDLWVLSPNGTKLSIYYFTQNLAAWTIYGGKTQGNYARVTGESILGMCNAVYDVWLNQNSSLTLARGGLMETRLGQAQDFRCDKASQRLNAIKVSN